MNTIIFEDEFVSLLEPIALAKPAYAVNCGGYRLCDLLSECGADGQRARGVVRPHLNALQRLDYPQLNGEFGGGPTLLVNARVAPTVSNARLIAKLAHEPFRMLSGKSVAAALLPAGQRVDVSSVSAVQSLFSSALFRDLPQVAHSASMLNYPHDVVRLHVQCMNENLRHRLQHGDYEEAAEGVFVSGEPMLGKYLVTDTSGGPILIEAEARIGPHCFLQGPLVIGPRARVIEHSSIKSAVCLGHTTKVGGEVEASIIEPYSNKPHCGFLGNAYVGSWVNLGAGTSNSNLKNTYGEIRVRYGERRVETGMQFFGCVLGDYAKSAINTSIFTGKMIGVGSMLYGFVAKNVPSFVNYAQSFGQVTEITADVMVETQRRMFNRRKLEQRECDKQLIIDMFQITSHQRIQLSSQPLSF